MRPAASDGAVRGVRKRCQGSNALWLVDRAEIGTIDSAGLFTAAGKAAGDATVEATVGSQKVTTTVTVKIECEQNGGIESDGGTTGGGIGGVGGEGEGGPVDSGLMAILLGSPTADATMKFLYPYDKTVFPLGLLAPLLQWTRDKVRLPMASTFI